jgi:ATP-dependent DNA helicase RecQ
MVDAKSASERGAGGAVAASEPPGPFWLTSWVRHPEWGRGLVTRAEGDTIIVLFEAVGEKRLAVEFVVTHRLLKTVQQ